MHRKIIKNVKIKTQQSEKIIPVNLMNAITQKNIKDKNTELLLPDVENVIIAKKFVDDNQK